MSGYFRSSVVAVVRVDPETLRQWRDRLGFVAAEYTAGGHSLYSVEQVCALRLATMLVANGVRAGVAVAIARRATPVFAKLVAEIDQSLTLPHICVIHRDGDDAEHDLFQVFCEAQICDVPAIAHNVAIVVDLLAIAHHVVCRLQDEGHPIIETGREAFAAGVRAVANGVAGASR